MQSDSALDLGELFAPRWSCSPVRQPSPLRRNATDQFSPIQGAPSHRHPRGSGEGGRREPRGKGKLSIRLPSAPRNQGASSAAQRREISGAPSPRSAYGAAES